MLTDVMMPVGPSLETRRNATYDRTDFTCFEGCFTANLMLEKREE